MAAEEAKSDVQVFDGRVPSFLLDDDKYKALKTKRKEIDKLPDVEKVDCCTINLTPFMGFLEDLLKGRHLSVSFMDKVIPRLSMKRGAWFCLLN